MIPLPPSTSARRAALPVLIALLVLPGCSRRDDAPAVDTASPSAPARPAPVAVMPLQLEALPARPGAVLARVTVRRDTSTFGVGEAVATLASGETVTVSDSAVLAWKLGGSLLAVSGLDGAGGYENEGQSLTLIDLATGTRRRVVADYFQIVRVELLEAEGKQAVLVHMRDGGQGSLHVTVVDPKRGQVFRETHALGRVANGAILVSGYGDGETPVDFGDKRTPLRVDTIAAASVATRPLLVIPRAQP